MGKSHFSLNKRYANKIKLTITQLLMALFEKFFRLHDPQTPLYQENITISTYLCCELVPFMRLGGIEDIGG